MTLGRYRLHLRQPALLREGFAGGFRELPMAVIPPLSLHPESRRLMLQTGEAAQQLTLKLVVRSNTENTGATGVLRVEHPAGWQVEPPQIDLALGPVGDAQTAKFEVTIPPDAPPGQYPLRYIVNSDGRDYDVVLEPVYLGAPGLPYLPDGATCIKEAFITKPAEVTVQVIDITFMPDLKYAYVEGAGDKMMTALSHFGLNFHRVSDDELDFIDLSQFDAVVIGPNAYLVRDNLRKNGARFLTYVEQGGTLIVQYQAYGYQDGDFAPYPFRYHQPHDRVTYEDAPVTLLAPDHPLVNLPNKITADDFDDWVIERGLYFFGEWDPRYEPMLAANDPGEEAKRGGMLVAGYGRGTYVYAAYSFFRQLPAGVPGAFRLLANLLSLPAARILKRTTLLKDVSIFAFMDETQLRAVAQIMSERWLATESWLGHEGDVEDEMYVITQGAVEIIRESSADQVIHVAQPGEVIGEMEVLGHIPRAAAMRAKGNVHLLVISGGDFRALMQIYPDMSARVIQMLVDKMVVTGRENREEVI
ncbi:MAG: cyclic nucleotide-binding domain-containing protein [Anaerolineales bacterium]|nr:cyclic nucleotide-binding domain-containing protein [Anaerolineales bacterium]